MTTTIATLTGTTTWNGGVCTICAARYAGSHSCTRDDILRRIGELSRLADSLPRMTTPDTSWDRARTCPCRPENGGSGVCGCVLSGPQITRCPHPLGRKPA